MAALTRVVFDCSLPNKEAYARITAAQIEGILIAEQKGKLTADEAAALLDALRSSARNVADAPDQVSVIELNADEIAQRAVDEEQARQDALEDLRRNRNRRLTDSDWTQIPDATLPGSTTDAQWVRYREKLRDFMATVTDPFNPPAWPKPPA